MFEEGNLLLFTPFYFKNGAMPQPKIIYIGWIKTKYYKLSRQQPNRLCPLVREGFSLARKLVEMLVKILIGIF